MKNNIKKLFILFILLLLTSITVILSLGNTYTLSFQNKGQECQLDIENYTGKVEILSEKKKKDQYLVKVKAKKPGKVYINIKYTDNYQNVKALYVHKSMIITDNSFLGKSTASEIIPISISLFLIYSLYLLIKEYKQGIKKNLYQYKNISRLGIIIYLSFFTISTIITIYSYKGLYDTVLKIINSMSTLIMVLSPLSNITFILVTISNINLIRKEGLSPRNLLGLLLGIFICVLPKIPDLFYKINLYTQTFDIYNLNSLGPYIYNYLESLVYLTISYLECILIATIIISIKCIKKKIEYNKDYIIILGCRISKDGTLPPLLRGRVDRALQFRNEQLEISKKDLIFISSGGKGNDECISEAEAIKKYLINQGIKSKNIIVENKSKNTYENIKYSYEKIKDKTANIIFSTTNYHILRAGIIATKQGLKIEGIGSKTKSYFWINAFIREFIGTIYSERKKHIITFILLMIIILIMISITYVGNNL